jgi:hypothetical protein
MRLLLVLGIMLAICPAAFGQENDLQWQSNEEGVSYGGSSGEDTLFFTTCKPNLPIEVWWHADVEKVPGMRVHSDGTRDAVTDRTVRIIIGGKEFEQTAKLQPEEMSGGLEVTFNASREFFETLISADNATLKVLNEEGATIPIKEGAALLRKICLP